jgi:hypothetical protein
MNRNTIYISAIDENGHDVEIVTRRSVTSTPSSAIGWSPAAEHFARARAEAEQREANAQFAATLDEVRQDNVDREVTKQAALRLRDEFGDDLLRKLVVSIQALVAEDEDAKAVDLDKWVIARATWSHNVAYLVHVEDLYGNGDVESATWRVLYPTTEPWQTVTGLFPVESHTFEVVDAPEDDPR